MRSGRAVSRKAAKRKGRAKLFACRCLPNKSVHLANKSIVFLTSHASSSPALHITYIRHMRHAVRRRPGVGRVSRVAHGCHQGRTRHIRAASDPSSVISESESHAPASLRQRGVAAQLITPCGVRVYAHLCYPSSPPRPMGERRTFRVRPTRPRPGVYKAVGSTSHRTGRLPFCALSQAAPQSAPSRSISSGRLDCFTGTTPVC